jgi:signal peptidase I
MSGSLADVPRDVHGLRVLGDGLRHKFSQQWELCWERRLPCMRSTILLVAVAFASGCGGSAAALTADRGASSRSGSAVGPYKVLSGSMEPTLTPSTRVFVRPSSPSMGDVVIFYPPEGGVEERCGPRPHVVRPGGAACDAPIHREFKVKLIQRVVAGPGDEMYVANGHVYRRAQGGHHFVRETDSYIRPCGAKPKCSFPTPIKIPPAHWFLMGDNRGESDDSREYGPIPTTWIVGVATGWECPVFANQRLTWVRRTPQQACPPEAS